MKPLFNLSHLQDSFDTLKDAIEYLAKEQKVANDRLDILENPREKSMVTPSPMSVHRGGSGLDAE